MHERPTQRPDACTSALSIVALSETCASWSARSGYGSPSEDFELSQAPVHKTVSGDEPEQVRRAGSEMFIAA